MTDEEFLRIEGAARQAANALSVAEAQYLAAQDKRDRCLNDFNNRTFELRSAQYARLGITDITNRRDPLTAAVQEHATGHGASA